MKDPPTVDYAKFDDIDNVLEVENDAWPSTEGGMQASRKKFETRVKNSGLLVAKNPNGLIMGILSFQKPAWTRAEVVSELLDFMKSPEYLELKKKDPSAQWDYISRKYGFPKDWYDATNDGFIEKDGISTHDPDSDVAFLIGVAVPKKWRGKKLVDLLIQNLLKKSKAEDLKYALGYARLPAFKNYITALEKTKSSDLSGLTSALYDPSNHVLEYINLEKPGTDLPLDYALRFHARNGARIVCPIPDAMYDDFESINYGALVIYELDDIL
jgi:hypothetical protein